MLIPARTVALASLAAVVLAAAGAAALVYFGFYNISALEQHTRPVYTLLDYAMRRSIRARLDGVQVPELDGLERIRRGASHFRTHCVQCHGAPGVGPDPLAFGMMPAPANLVETARAWRPAEIFWVVRHGVKMSGMPAWVGRLRDEEIWDVVAFVRASAHLSPQQYAALVADLPAHEHARPPEDAQLLAGERAGDPAAGLQAVRRHLCATCHVIPGVVAADRHVGPPLTGMGTRAYIAGILPNTPDNMVRWLRDPHEVDPSSAMPPLGIGAQDARDMAAFLATLDGVKAR